MRSDRSPSCCTGRGAPLLASLRHCARAQRARRISQTTRVVARNGQGAVAGLVRLWPVSRPDFGRGLGVHLVHFFRAVVLIRQADVRDAQQKVGGLLRQFSGQGLKLWARRVSEWVRARAYACVPRAHMRMCLDGGRGQSSRAGSVPAVCMCVHARSHTCGGCMRVGTWLAGPMRARGPDARTPRSKCKLQVR